MSYHMRFGPTSADFEIVWDGTTASFLVGAGETMQVGGAANYSEFEPDGTLLFAGDAKVWDDLQVPLSSVRVGATQVPAFSQIADDGGTSVGVYAFIFPDNTLKQVFFSVQLPHGYALGTTLHPHVHWAPQTTDTGTVNWELEYTLANIGGTFPNTTTIAVNGDGAGTINDHLYAENETISGAGISGVSAMLICRLFRDGGVGADDFVGDAALLEFDIHYEIDTVGSRTELTK